MMLRDAAIEMGILIAVDPLRSWSGQGQVAKLKWEMQGQSSFW